MTDGPDIDERDDDESDDTDGRRYRTLDAALSARPATPANAAFLERLLTGIDVEHFVPTSSYLKVVRSSGEPALHIHHGWTNGFRSREEIVAAVGENAAPWASARMQHTWGVSHPDHGEGRGDGNGKRQKATGGICPTCGMMRPLSGVCDLCH